MHGGRAVAYRDTTTGDSDRGGLADGIDGSAGDARGYFVSCRDAAP